MIQESLFVPTNESHSPDPYLGFDYEPWFREHAEAVGILLDIFDFDAVVKAMRQVHWTYGVFMDDKNSANWVNGFDLRTGAANLLWGVCCPDSFGPYTSGGLSARRTSDSLILETTFSSFAAEVLRVRPRLIHHIAIAPLIHSQSPLIVPKKVWGNSFSKGGIS